MQDILDEVGDVNACLVKELTKIHEQKLQGSISQLINDCQTPKGEFIIILDLNKAEVEQEKSFETMTLEEHYAFYEKQGLDKKEIIKQIAKDKKVNKNEIYQIFMNKKGVR